MEGCIFLNYRNSNLVQQKKYFIILECPIEIVRYTGPEKISKTDFLSFPDLLEYENKRTVGYLIR